ncbi:MAG: MBL fold metallo-hydrolase [Planctomycetota bacterium]
MSTNGTEPQGVRLDRRAVLGAAGAALAAGFVAPRMAIAQAEPGPVSGLDFSGATTSVYHHRVGSIDVLIVSDGLFPVATPAVGTNAARDDVNAWLAGEFLGAESFQTPLNTMVVRSGDRLVLVDAGMGELAGMGDAAGRTLERLRAAGVDPRRITDVVLTHLHPDHIGLLISGDGLGAFSPEVTVHVSAREVEFWSQPADAVVSALSTLAPEFRPAATGAAKEALRVAGSRLKTFSAQDDEIVPGVVGRITPGHTPGHATIRVESGEESLAFVGDAILWTSFDHPDWNVMFDTTPDQAVRTRARMLERFARRGTVMCAAHLSFPSLGRVARRGESYRFVPLMWGH